MPVYRYSLGSGAPSTSAAVRPRPRPGCLHRKHTAGARALSFLRRGCVLTRRGTASSATTWTPSWRASARASWRCRCARAGRLVPCPSTATTGAMAGACEGRISEPPHLLACVHPRPCVVPSPAARRCAPACRLPALAAFRRSCVFRSALPSSALIGVSHSLKARNRSSAPTTNEVYQMPTRSASWACPRTLTCRCWALSAAWTTRRAWTSSATTTTTS